jgi:hypothetical protein
MDPNALSPRVRVDRYGWTVRDPREMTEDELQRQRAESAAELRREQKWLTMLGHWELYWDTKQPKLRERVFKGIPDCLRGKVWQNILDHNFDREQVNRHAVSSLVSMSRLPSVDTIEVDLARTLPKMAMFSETNVRDSLKRVLHAYTNVDPEVGYVQGMAFPAAMLLSYMDETRAFWCFMRLMAGEKFQFRRLYMNSFEGLRSINKVWERLLSIRYKRVSDNFAQKGVMSGLYSTSWFLTAFMNVDFHPALRLRIFDRYVMFGHVALLSFALVIIAVNEEVLSTGNLTQILAPLQKPEQSEKFKDSRKLIAAYDKLWIKPKEYEKLFRTVGIPVFY